MAKDDNKPVTKKSLIAILGDFFVTTILPYFERIEERFEKIDKRFDKIEEHLDQHDRRFDKLDDRLDRHGKMLDSHEKEIADLQRAILN